MLRSRPKNCDMKPLSTQRTQRRFLQHFCAFALPLLIGATNTWANENQSKSFKVHFSAVQNSCDKSSGKDLGTETVTLSVDASGNVELAIKDLPPLLGKIRKGGKFSAKAEPGKGSADSKEGPQGKHRVVGRESQGKLRLLLISEFYKNGEPACTQSWNGE